MAADAPLAALLCSIFVGPLGIQGWIIDPANPKYQGLGVHQRRISIALHIILAIVIIGAIYLAGKTKQVSKKYNDNEAGRRAIAEEVAGAVTLTSVAYGALGITTFVSFIIAIILLVRSNNNS